MAYNNRFKLTPMPATNRWRKIHQGKIYYVGIGHCSNKNDRAGYKVALADWQAIKDKMDNEPTELERHLYDLSLERAEVAVETEQTIGQLDDATLDELRAQDERIRKSIDQFRERRAIAAVTRKVKGKPHAETVEAYATDFLKTKQDRHAIGALSANRVRSVEQHLTTIKDCLGKDTLVSTIGDTSVKAYWQFLVDQIKAGKIGRTTASDRWHLFKEFIRSIYAIPVPRNLGDRALSFGKPSKTVVPWTVDEVKALLAKTPHERFELWILLMLNCGMYSKDISDLKPSEVNWEAGRIIRKRSKTEHLATTPAVNYKLWDRTFELLKKYGNGNGDRVLLNRGGNALVQQFYKPNGKMKNQDTVYDAYRHAYPKPRKHLKALRKTGASLLETHDVYCMCVEIYLAHTVATVTDRSYRNYSQDRFDAAISWLGEQLGIDGK